MGSHSGGDDARSWRRPAGAGGLLVCALLVGLGLTATVHAATRTWTGLGLTNNWTDTGNWSGNVLPGAADVATFDATSSKNATINGVVNVAGVSIGAGYAGTVTQGPGIAVTVGATGFSQTGGTFAGGTSAVTVNGPFTFTSGSFAATSGTLSVSGNFTVSGGVFAAGAGTMSFGGGAATLSITTADTFNNLTFAAGTKTVAAGTTLTVSGVLSLTDGSINTGTVAAQGAISQATTFDGGTGTLLINGAGAQTFSGAATTTAGDIPALVINKPSGTLTLAGTIRTTHAWTYSAGTLDPGTSTVVFSGGTVSGAHTLNAVGFRATTSIAAGTTLTISGSTTLTAGSLNGTGTLAAQGDVSQAVGYGGGTATLRIDGAGDQTLTGASTTASGNLPLVVIDKPSGTLTLAGTIRTVRTPGRTPRARSIPARARSSSRATCTVSGSHSLANVVIATADHDRRRRHDRDRARRPDPDRRLHRHRHRRRAGSDQPGLDLRRRHGHPAASTAAATRRFTGASTTAAGSLPTVVIDKPVGHAHPGRHDPDRPTGRTPRARSTPGTSHGRLRGRPTVSGSHSAQRGRAAGTIHSIAAGTTLTVAAPHA